MPLLNYHVHIYKSYILLSNFWFTWSALDPAAGHFAIRFPRKCSAGDEIGPDVLWKIKHRNIISRPSSVSRIYPRLLKNFEIHKCKKCDFPVARSFRLAGSTRNCNKDLGFLNADCSLNFNHFVRSKTTLVTTVGEENWISVSTPPPPTIAGST